MARADIKGPYVINSDGAALDDRFADGWAATDVAATDPGAVDGATHRPAGANVDDRHLGERRGPRAECTQ